MIQIKHPSIPQHAYQTVNISFSQHVKQAACMSVRINLSAINVNQCISHRVNRASQKANQNLNSPVINPPASAPVNQSLNPSSTRAIDQRLTPVLRPPHVSIPLITTTQYTTMNTTATAAYRILATFIMSTRLLLWFSSSSHRPFVTPWLRIQRNRAVRSFTWRSTNTWKITCRKKDGFICLWN